ncbi:MAG TPA: DinB family protein [Propionibacteriaceae bacterium]|nr:DinB family protein [Propionibacteriaceae bacterium]
MTDDDKPLLLAYLNSARAHVRAVLDGVSETDRHRPLVPSGWSMVGLVQHLTFDVERFWFRVVMAGEDATLFTGSDAWQVAAGTPSTEVLAAYERECALADEIIERTPLDATAALWREEWGPLHVESLLDVVVHVLKETATHAGHLDVARELLDGHQHLVLTDVEG